MNIVDLIITIVTLIVVYKFFEEENVKGAFIFRLVVALINYFIIKGNDVNEIFLLAKLTNGGTLILILLAVIYIAWLYITNLLEYHAAFKPYGHMIVVYIFVCILIDWATQFLFTGVLYLLRMLLGIIF